VRASRGQEGSVLRGWAGLLGVWGEANPSAGKLRQEPSLNRVRQICTAKFFDLDFSEIIVQPDE